MRKFVVVGVFVFALMALLQPLQAKVACGPADEVVKMTAQLNVLKCHISGKDFCLNGMISLDNVQIPLFRRDVPQDAGYDLWEGAWQDEKSEEGIPFSGGVLIQKYKYHADEGEPYVNYRIEGDVGRVLSSKKPTRVILNVSSPDELNSLVVVGDEVFSNEYLLTPQLHIGRALDVAPIFPDPNEPPKEPTHP